MRWITTCARFGGEDAVAMVGPIYGGRINEATDQIRCSSSSCSQLIMLLLLFALFLEVRHLLFILFLLVFLVGGHFDLRLQLE